MKVLVKYFHLNGPYPSVDLKVKTTLYSEISSSAMFLFKKLGHISFSVKISVTHREEITESLLSDRIPIKHQLTGKSRLIF